MNTFNSKRILAILLFIGLFSSNGYADLTKQNIVER
ncbi:MAG: hypothetical protein ACI81I_000103 [Arcobacteraceae bacterium]|jgi:hypothetical protein